MTSSDVFSVEVEGDVATLWLDRPAQRNASGRRLRRPWSHDGDGTEAVAWRCAGGTVEPQRGHVALHLDGEDIGARHGGDGRPSRAPGPAPGCCALRGIPAAVTIELRYRVVDVFSDRPLAGNALCVVLDPCPEPVMSAIARRSTSARRPFQS